MVAIVHGVSLFSRFGHPDTVGPGSSWWNRTILEGEGPKKEAMKLLSLES